MILVVLKADMGVWNVRTNDIKIQVYDSIDFRVLRMIKKTKTPSLEICDEGIVWSM